MPDLPRNGSDQAAHDDSELARFLHLWAMNRGILMTPFHNMALMSPATNEADVDRHTEAFAAAVDASPTDARPRIRCRLLCWAGTRAAAGRRRAQVPYLGHDPCLRSNEAERAAKQDSSLGLGASGSA
jgi:hypothetical protein